MINKKGQGISINVIIIAAIALAVLVVLFAVFTGRIGLFTKGVKTSEDVAYKCVCSAPDKNRACAAALPTGKPEVESSIAGCAQWTDCAAPLKCYSLQ